MWSVRILIQLHHRDIQVSGAYINETGEFGDQELPRFEAELIHGSDCCDEVILRVLGSIIPFLQHCPNCVLQQRGTL